MVRPCLIAMALLVAGCGAQPQLPAPGARGQVVFHLYDERGEQPTVAVAEAVRQRGLRFELLELDRVRMRVPVTDGALLIESPRATYAAKGGSLVLEGPVRVVGRLQGSPLLGHAAEARYQRGDRRLRLREVEFQHRGVRSTAPEADLVDGRQIELPRGLAQDTAPPGARAMLSALPPSLDPPAPRRE